MRFAKKRILLLFICLFVFIMSCGGNGDGNKESNDDFRIYVDSDANGNNDGISWENAFKYLQDALAMAISGNEIWVAEGIYKPDQNNEDPNGSGERTASFQLKNGVAIYGGFEGLETKLDERDWETHLTILSGDLNSDDDPNFIDYYEENSYHIVTGQEIDATGILDGFIITAGYAYDDGSGSDYDEWGGGMYNSDSNPTVTNCTFSGNHAMKGGGMYNSNSHPTLTNCSFIDNWADNGGGMYNSGSSPLITYCLFHGNWAKSYGGGISNDESHPNLNNCTFSINLSENQGGAMCSYSSSLRLSNCFFSMNGSFNEGGGMYNYDSSLTVNNCSFIGNWADSGGGMCNNSGNGLMISRCTFIGNSADSYGGGMCNWDNNPSIINCLFTENLALSSGGGMDYYYSSPEIINCTFSWNLASDKIGGGMFCESSNPDMINCILWDNYAILGPQIGITDSTISIQYSDIQGGETDIYKDANTNSTVNWDTDSIIDSDPNFVDPNNYNYHLNPNSPCIDSGTNDNAPEVDLEGMSRPLDGNDDNEAICDMGAYEESFGF